jgi:hypothetical protein
MISITTTIFSVVETMFFATGTIFSDTESIFSVPDTTFFATHKIFSVAQKTAGEAPAVSYPLNQTLKGDTTMLPHVRIADGFRSQSAEQLAATAAGIITGLTGNAAFPASCAVVPSASPLASDRLALRPVHAADELGSVLFEPGCPRSA